MGHSLDMERLMRVLAAFVICCISIAQVAAEERDTDSANYFIAPCKSLLASTTNSRVDQVTVYREGICFGTVKTLVGVGELLPDVFRFCMPTNATISQAVRIAVRYIEERPARMHEPFVLLSIEALRQAWPCRK
jgi:hypothetical protein